MKKKKKKRFQKSSTPHSTTLFAGSQDFNMANLEEYYSQRDPAARSGHHDAGSVWKEHFQDVFSFVLQSVSMDGGGSLSYPSHAANNKSITFRILLMRLKKSTRQFPLCYTQTEKVFLVTQLHSHPQRNYPFSTMPV